MKEDSSVFYLRGWLVVLFAEMKKSGRGMNLARGRGEGQEFCLDELNLKADI